MQQSHLARQGKVGIERTMEEELNRPLLPVIERLKTSEVRIGLGLRAGRSSGALFPDSLQNIAFIDESIVIDGSFNWYNTSVFSHDLIVVAANREVPKPYLYEFERIQQLFRGY